MKNLVNMTGGLMILTDSFATSIFKQSFQRIFEKDEAGDLNMGANASLEILVMLDFHPVLAQNDICSNATYCLIIYYIVYVPSQNLWSYWTCHV